MYFIPTKSAILAVHADEVVSAIVKDVLNSATNWDIRRDVISVDPIHEFGLKGSGCQISDELFGEEHVYVCAEDEPALGSANTHILSYHLKQGKPIRMLKARMDL